jgi:hypothetical protein
MARVVTSLIVLCSVSILSGGCKKAEPASETKVAAPPPPVVAAAPVTPPAFVLFQTVLKREPNEKAKVDEKGKPVMNWQATLVRGEVVSSLGKTEGDYLKVRASDDAEGWVKAQSLLSGSEVFAAAVLEDAETFDRPDPLALNSKREVKAGSLVFVTKTRDQFDEVSAAGLGTVWVLEAKLARDEPEVTVAGLLARARELTAAHNAEGAEDTLRLAKRTFPGSKLVASATEFEGIVVETAPADAAPAEHESLAPFDQNCAPTEGEQEEAGHAERVLQQCPHCDGLRACLKTGATEDCAKQFPADATECLEWCKE